MPGRSAGADGDESMVEKIWKPNEPRGDPSRHLDLAALEDRHRRLAAGDRDLGRVSLIVRRLPDGARETPMRTRLDVETGVPGDDWVERPPRDPEAQIAVMQTGLATLIANGQPLTTFVCIVHLVAGEALHDLLTPLRSVS